MGFRGREAMDPWGDALALVCREAAEEALQQAGSSRRAASLLVSAGFTSAAVLVSTPWSAEEADSQYVSAEWRLSVRPGCTPGALAEIRAFRDHLAGVAAA
jgi:hypothetical protein